MGTCADTFVAPDASVPVDYPDMTMAQKINFPENLFGACRNTFPASDAIVWIDGNKRRCHALL